MGKAIYESMQFWLKTEMLLLFCMHSIFKKNIFFITAQLPFSTRVACNENEMVVDVLSSSSHLITEAYLQGLKNYPGKSKECYIIIMLPAINAGRLTWSPSKSSDIGRSYILHTMSVYYNCSYYVSTFFLQNLLLPRNEMLLSRQSYNFQMMWSVIYKAVFYFYLSPCSLLPTPTHTTYT